MFKRIIDSLKLWHQNHVQNKIVLKEKQVKDIISSLDSKGEEVGLTEQDVEEMHELAFNFHSFFRMNSNMNWQKSRMLWLADGDTNLKFFHGIMSNRRRGNAIIFLTTNGIQVEGVENVCSHIFNHFCNHIKALIVDWPSVEKSYFQFLCGMEGGNLVRPFSVEEVRHVVWAEIKYDLIRIMSEFHQTGQLSNGIN